MILRVNRNQRLVIYLFFLLIVMVGCQYDDLTIPCQDEKEAPLPSNISLLLLNQLSMNQLGNQVTFVEQDEDSLEVNTEKAATALGYFEMLPTELLELILSKVGLKPILSIRQASRSFYKLITGSEEICLVGLENKPKGRINLGSDLIKRSVYFANRKLRGLSPEQVPVFPFYCLIDGAHSIPQSFWPYLSGTRLHTIDLSCGTIRATEVIELARCLSGTHVHTLDLSRTRLGEAEAIGLAKYLPNTPLHTLNLKVNEINENGAVELVKSLPFTQVHTINLCYNKIGTTGAMELAKYLPSTRLCNLDLSINKIGAKGALEVVKSLADTQVHTLNLNCSEIGVTGAIDLVKCLSNTRIHTLNLSWNEINAKGAVEIIKCLPSTQIHTINLSWNNIGNSGAIELAKYLPNTRIHTLYFTNNWIDNATQQLLQEQYPNIKWIFVG